MVALPWSGPFGDIGIRGHDGGHVDDTATELARIQARMIEMLAPVTRVQTRRDLDRLVEYFGPEYSRLMARAGEITLRDSDLSAADIEPGRNALDRKVAGFREVFGDEAYERFTSAVDSIAALAEFAIEFLQHVVKAGGDGSKLARFSALYSLRPEFVYAIMTSSATVGVIDGEISGWDPKSVRLLAIATDEYMIEVEDDFLAADTFDEDDDDDVPIDEVLAELGI